MRWLGWVGLGLVWGAAAAACGGSGDADRGGAFGGTGNAPGTGGVATGGSGNVGNTGNAPGTGGTGAFIGVEDSGTGLDPDAACEAVTQRGEQAFQPADIIWAVDTSGSMFEEALFVQNNLNVFSQQIVASGIDVRVVMIAQAAIIPFIPSVCIPPPLGSGACPVDTNPPAYWHHPMAVVSSNDGLNIFMNTFQDWRFMLRPQATHTLVVVTDDDATQAPYNSADQFIADFTALDPMLDDGSGNPNWKMSGIYSFTNCPTAASVGSVWQEIIQRTGGIAGDLCTQNFAPVFNDLATAIVQGSQPIDCEWVIPPPPMGQTFDKSRVNVEFTDTAGMTQTVFAVDDAGACDPALGGWYYDDPANPNRVLACPETCTTIQSEVGNQIDIAFGCATIQIPR